MKLAAAAALCLSAAAPTEAATLYAQSIYPDGWSDFSITFDDTNKNSLFDLDELTGFSGATTIYGLTVLVIVVPAIAGISVAGIVEGVTIYDPSRWNFELAGRIDNAWDVAVSNDAWTYRIDGLAPVPLPAGIVLALSSLGAMGLVTRRKRN